MFLIYYSICVSNLLSLMPWPCKNCTCLNENDDFLSCEICLSVRDLSGPTLLPTSKSPVKTSPSKQGKLSDSAWGATSLSQAVRSFKADPVPVRTESQSSPKSSADKSATFMALFEKHQLAKTKFVDEEFTCSMKSLDGSNNSNSTPNCKCGLPAVCKFVSKPGPNQGRPYLSCHHNVQTFWNSPPPGVSSPSFPSKCKFFNFTTFATIPPNPAYEKLTWHRLPSPTLFNNNNLPSSNDVRQGSLGDCWFESAMAGLTNRPDLVANIFSSTHINSVGIYELHLYVTGAKKSVIIDDHFPMKTKTLTEKTKLKTYNTTFAGRGAKHLDELSLATPAFTAAPTNVIWPALIEKAYAKAYNNYRALTGGYVCEALHDLTGAPFMQIHLNEIEINKEELFVRLLSFVASDFVVGLSCMKTNKEKGLVGGHAYSLLDVIIISDVKIGRQQKLGDFFQTSDEPRPKKKKQKLELELEEEEDDDDEVTIIEKPKPITNNDDDNTPTTLKLVKVRNPWGRREWVGAWGAKSELWTNKIRNTVGDTSFSSKSAEGAAWMSYDDFFESFSGIDVCCVRAGYKRFEFPIVFGNFNNFNAESAQIWNFASEIVKIHVVGGGFVDIMLAQPHKRAHAADSFWYQDANFVCVRRAKNNTEANFEAESILLGGEIRLNQAHQLYLESGYDYFFVIFSSNKKKENALTFVFYANCEVCRKSCEPKEVHELLNNFPR